MRCIRVQNNSVQACVFQIPQSSCARCRGLRNGSGFLSPTVRRGLRSPWHRQPQVAPGHGAIGLFPPHYSCVCWDHQRARASVTSQPPFVSANPPSAHEFWDADGPELTHYALPSARNGTATGNVSPESGCGGKVAFFLNWFLLQPQKMGILQHQHFVPKQTLSPGHIMTPGCLEEERWKWNTRKTVALDSSPPDWYQESASISKKCCFHEQFNHTPREFRSAQRAHTISRVFVTWLLIICVILSLL